MIDASVVIGYQVVSYIERRRRTLNKASSDPSITHAIMSTLMRRGDSVVAIAGLFANVGIFGMKMGEIAGNVLYAFIILFGVVVSFGLWRFRPWGWLLTVLFSIICIILVLPQILNYHAALISMILLSYIIQPSVRQKYMSKENERPHKPSAQS